MFLDNTMSQYYFYFAVFSSPLLQTFKLQTQNGDRAVSSPYHAVEKCYKGAKINTKEALTANSCVESLILTENKLVRKRCMVYSPSGDLTQWSNMSLKYKIYLNVSLIVPLVTKLLCLQDVFPKCARTEDQREH